eukprot:1751250-Prymnesium_polylepis.1
MHEELLTGAAGEVGLARAVVVVVVRAHYAACRAHEGDELELREAVELIDRGREAEVHAGQQENGGLAGGGVDLGDHRKLRRARAAAAVGRRDVVGAAAHGPAGHVPDGLEEAGGGAGGEVGGVARDGLGKRRDGVVAGAGVIVGLQQHLEAPVVLLLKGGEA